MLDGIQHPNDRSQADMVRGPDGLDDLLDRINGILGKIATRSFLVRKAGQMFLCEGRQFGGRATAQEWL